MSTERPVFVFACGWRSGSTLLQRLLCSHREIHVWGENVGMCSDLLRVYAVANHRLPLSSGGEVDDGDSGADAWIANWSPPPSDLALGMAALLYAYLAMPAQRRGKSRWGFKEVRHGRDVAQFLRMLFPAAKFILLVRHPQHCLASARATETAGHTGLLAEVGGVSKFLDHWERLAASFISAACSDAELLIRYEDMIRDPRGTVVGLADFLEVEESCFQRNVFGSRRRGWKEAEPRLVDEDIRHLEAANLWSTARRFGYEFESPSEQ